MDEEAVERKTDVYYHQMIQHLWLEEMDDSAAEGEFMVAMVIKALIP